MSTEQLIQHLSTDSIPQGSRFDFWMSLVGESVWPVTDWSGISDDFAVDMRAASFGCLASIEETAIGAARARRTRRDVESSIESCYCLFVTDSTGYWAQNGHDHTSLPGDVVLIGQNEHDSHMNSKGFKSNIIKLPTHWVHSWLPDPELIAGYRIARDSRWGQVLSPMITQLTPEFVVAPPVPQTVLADQIGSILALISGEA